ncbi:MAG: UbiA family prenyltransferase [Candidatus Limnocylindria bacterium]
MGGLGRLVHPFPSLLDGVVAGGVALVAGAAMPTALGVGVSMTSLQFAIGALNDVHDAPHDVGRVPPKPIPSGLVSPDAARVVVVVAASLGLGLAATFGTALLLLAGLGLVVGFGYDLLAKGTPWSWLPFAIGIPLLPLYGWVGATGTVPSWAVALLPAAALAGGAIAVANARADVEQDRVTGVTTVATSLGERATAVLALAWAGAAAVAVGGLVALGAEPGSLAPVLAAFGAIAVGVAVGRSGGPERLEWAWRIQAVAAAVAAVAWLVAVIATEP